MFDREESETLVGPIMMLGERLDSGGHFRGSILRVTRWSFRSGLFGGGGFNRLSTN